MTKERAHEARMSAKWSDASLLIRCKSSAFKISDKALRHRAKLFHLAMPIGLRAKSQTMKQAAS